MKAQFQPPINVKIYCCLIIASIILYLPQTGNGQQKKDTQPAPAATSQPPQKSPVPGVDEQVIINTDLISFNVTVTDTYGRFVSGLKKNAFTILDEKTPQEITFFSDEDAPVSVGIVFDMTGSMSGEKVQRAREALTHFIETSHDQDEYFLIGLQNSRANLLMDKTRDSKALLDKLTYVETKGNTAFYDACYLAAEKITHGAHPKRALLVISDGQDNNSRYTFSDLRKMLKESDVIIYTIGIEGAKDGELGMEGSAIMDEIAGVSGGKAFFPNSSAEMDDVFERIAVELRHQYAIGYKPSNFAPDGKWHHVKVKVTPPRGLPHLFVRNKEGYYALTNPR